MTTLLIKRWENSDGCAEQYRCASALYLMSVMSQCYSVTIDRGISAPGHGKEVVDGLNYVDKHHIYQLMFKVQLPGSNRFDSQMKMHTDNQKYDESLAKEFQHHVKKITRKSCVFDQIKKNKQFMERKWTYIQYHVQYNAEVAQKYVKMYFNTNTFPTLNLCGPHSKPNGARGLSKHYHLLFDPKLGNGVCEIRRGTE